MCGFLTEFTFQTGALPSQDEFSTLLALSKHRGPDSTQIESGSQYRLGFNRLAILDLSAQGNQPKYSPSQRYHVVFNGEIYNYRELAQHYALTQLESHSDTEVLVHLLDVLGIEPTFKVLNGMFAIAVVDTKLNTLHLARDFAGIKPLFYGVSNQGVVAASQFDQVFKHPWFKNGLELCPEVMKAYFGYGYMQAPETIYKTIFQVNPGEWLSITADGVITKHPFKLFATKIPTALSEDEAYPMLQDLLHASVKKQLVSDVPLASFLSGGIDSPLISAIAKAHEPNLRAFTMAVDDKALDESEKASAYASILDLKHTIEPIHEEELLTAIDTHFKFFPEPFGDYSSIPTFLITKKARQNYTVMLSGDGGDELFFGYPRLLEVITHRFWFHIPFWFRRPLVRLANKLGLLSTWGPYHYKTIGDWVSAKQRYIFEDQLNAMMPDVPLSTNTENGWDFKSVSSGKRLLAGLRAYEFYGHLQRVLTKVDRMSMANSLEVRVPFLDLNFVEQAFQTIPRRFKSKPDLKRILKRMLSNYVPPQMIAQEKKGFTVPLDTWLNHQLHADLKKVIFDTPIYGENHLNVIELRAYVQAYYDKKHDAAWGVWHIYAWQKWALAHQLI
ncbi:asparagine synthase (glutamine-hydrolysing) [Flavobacteriaceae bacterium MAR_2010_72]|nr:asparagine synthase (glutamine-hydrolysing) [Flavobacteriaceae bacterium MAR_2010_72]